MQRSAERGAIPLIALLLLLASSVLQAQPYPCPGGFTSLGAFPVGPTITFDTDALTVNGVPVGAVVSGGVTYFAYNSITVPAGTTVVGVGSRPLGLVAAGPIVVSGTINGNGGNASPTAPSCQPNGPVPQGGPGGGAGGIGINPSPGPGQPGGGPGGGGGGPQGTAGAGGAGYGGVGGTGGGAGAGLGGIVYGNLYVSLLGGSGGGGAGTQFTGCQGAHGGGGGGGIILASNTSIVIDATGLVTCNGGIGNFSDTGGSGGGGGGAIILYSSSVVNNGIVRVNGATGGPGGCCGGGGSGAGGRILVSSASAGSGSYQANGGAGTSGGGGGGGAGAAGVITFDASTWPVVITQQPQNATVCEGASAAFFANATGFATVQWERSIDGGVTWTSIPGAITQLLFVSPVTASMNNYQYRAVFTSAQNCAAITNPAVLTVYLQPVVTVHPAPASQSVCDGATVTYTAAATGTPTPTVQWQQSTDGGATYSDIAGATSTTYSFTATLAMNGYMFRAYFTNICNTAYTNPATLLVPNTAPVVTLDPVNVTVCAGATATFTSAATGTPTPTVQWQLSTDAGATWNNIAGATNASYTTPPTTAGMNGYQYRAMWTNICASVPSAAAILTVDTAPAITLNPVNQTVCAPATATFTASASGSPAPTVQWQLSTNGGSTFGNIAGATSSSYTTPATSASMNGYQYRAVFTNTCGTATTTAAILTVNTAPVISQNPTNQTVCAPNSATFTAAATGSPTPTVQWQLSTDGGGTFNNIAGATSTSYNTGATSTAMSGYQYRAVFTNTCGTATTTAAVLTVNSPPTITLNPTNQTVCVGTSATFNSAGTGTPSPTVQWYYSTNGGSTWLIIAGATNPDYTFPNAQPANNGWQFRATYTNTCGSVNTTAAILTVNTAPSITSNPTSQSVCAGATVSFSVTATGAGLTYQWQESINGGGTFNNLSNAGVYSGVLTPTMTITGVTAGMNGYMYRCVVSGICSPTPATSTAATLTVNSAPVITQNPTSQAVCQGATVTFSASATGSPPISYQWQFSTNSGVNWNDIPGATSSSYTIVGVVPANAGQYRCRATNICGVSVYTSAATLTVYTPPSMSVQWGYSMPITINNGGGARTNYFTLVRVNTNALITAGKMRADGGDMRFYDALNNPLNFFVQNGLNTAVTNIWVKVPSVPSGSSTIYMNYGNPLATRVNQASDVFGTGIAAMYTFTEGSGAVLNDWAGGNNLNVTCSWTTGFRSNVGALTNFNVGRAFAAINGPSIGTGSFTVVDYIYPTNANGTTQGIIGNYYSDGTNGWVHKLQGSAGQFMLLTNQAGSWCQSSVGGLVNNTWQMSGVRRQAGVQNNGFVNGSVSGGPFCAGDTRNLTNTGPMEIGRSYNGSYPFSGSISMSLIYNTALTDPQVAALHNSIYALPEPTLNYGAEQQVTSITLANLCPNQLVTLSVTVTGDPTPTIQWQVSTDNGSTWSNIPGATSSTYSFNFQITDHLKQFRATASNICGTAVSLPWIVLKDAIPPVIVCPANIVRSTDPGQCFAVVTFTPTATDNCGPPAVVCAPPSGSTFPKGSTTVTCVATDGTANSAACSFTVTVNDTELPQITAPGPLTLYADFGVCGKYKANFNLGTPTVSDNCPGVTYSNNAPTLFPVGTTNVIWTATDASGNTRTATQTVTILDNQPPRVNAYLTPTTLVPANQTMRSINAYITVTDNCPGASFILYSVTSSDPDAGMFPGDLPNDIQGAGLNSPDTQFLLRAERAWSSRTYTVKYRGIDAYSNTAMATRLIVVPVTPFTGTYVYKDTEDGTIPAAVTLDQNYPNPFNPTTTIRFTLPTDGTVMLTVYDQLGRRVATLVDEAQTAGSYTAVFDASSLPSGLYTYVLEASGTVLKKTMSLVK